MERYSSLAKKGGAPQASGFPTAVVKGPDFSGLRFPEYKGVDPDVDEKLKSLWQRTPVSTSKGIQALKNFIEEKTA